MIFDVHQEIKINNGLKPRDDCVLVFVFQGRVCSILPLPHGDYQKVRMDI